MNTSKPVLLGVALLSLAFLGVALYLQHVERMLPCPLCIIQRYLFAALALICLLFALLPGQAGTRKAGAGLGLLTALGGAGVAGWHMWIQAHPTVSCGIDPLETALNTYPTATLLPFLFKADGLCSAGYAPILGLSIPQWSFAWFAIFAIVLGVLFFKRRR
jgi:protein dithiol:quinone oxidoreductase